MLLAVRTNPSELRRIALAVQHVLERERLVIRPVAGEAVQVVTRCVGEQRGEGQRALPDKFRHDAGDVRVQVNEALGQ